MTPALAAVVAALGAQVHLIRDDDAYARMAGEQEKSVGLAVSPSACAGCMRAGEAVLGLLQASSLQRRYKFFLFLLDADAMERLRPLYALEQPATLLLFMREQVEKLREFATAAELRAAAASLLALLQRRMEALGREVRSLAELRAELRSAQTLFGCLPARADGDAICQTLAEENLSARFVRITEPALRGALLPDSEARGVICVFRSEAQTAEDAPSQSCQPLGSAEADRAFVAFQRAPRIRAPAEGADLLKDLFWRKHAIFFLYAGSAPEAEEAFRHAVRALPRAAHFFVLRPEDSDPKFENLFAIAKLAPRPGRVYAAFVDAQRQLRSEEMSDTVSDRALRVFFWRVYRLNPHLMAAVGLTPEAAEGEL